MFQIALRVYSLLSCLTRSALIWLCFGNMWRFTYDMVFWSLFVISHFHRQPSEMRKFFSSYLWWLSFFIYLVPIPLKDSYSCLRPATLLKRDSGAEVFLWILGNFSEHLFYRAPSDDYFCLFVFEDVGCLKKRIQNLIKHLNTIKSFS